jgi:hypothetical protein
MDNLLAGKLILPFQGRSACHCQVQRRLALWNRSGIIANAIPGSNEKPFASRRNRVRLQPGMLFAITESRSRWPGRTCEKKNDLFTSGEY